LLRRFQKSQKVIYEYLEELEIPEMA